MVRAVLALSGWLTAAVVVTLALSSEPTKLRQECGAQLVGLSPCLSYVGGNAKSPTIDCCNNLEKVLTASKKCICLLVQNRNDANVGVDINVNLALGLPAVCRQTPIYNCPALLHLSPNSPDAKVFTDFYERQNATTASTTSSPVTVTPGSMSSDSKANDGGPSMRRSGAITVIQGAVLLFIYRLF